MSGIDNDFATLDDLKEMTKKIDEDKEISDTALTVVKNKTIENARIMEANNTKLSREMVNVEETQATQTAQIQALGRDMVQMQQTQQISAGQMDTLKCELQTMRREIDEDKEDSDTALTAVKNKTIENARIIEANNTRLLREVSDVKETQATQAARIDALGRDMVEMQQTQQISAEQMETVKCELRKEIDETKKVNSEENYITRKRMAEQFQERDKRAKLVQREQYGLICGVQESCKSIQESAMAQNIRLGEQERETEALKQEMQAMKRKMEVLERKEQENTSTPRRLQQLKQFLYKTLWRTED